MKYIHINVGLELNENTWSWSNPRVNESINFSIPVEMLEPKRLTDMILSAMKEMERKFPDAVLEYEKEQAEKEAEKATAEVKA